MNNHQDDRPDLTFVETNDLVKELGRRFEHFAWIGDNSRTAVKYETNHGLKSHDALHVIGLLEYLKQQALASFARGIYSAKANDFFD